MKILQVYNNDVRQESAGRNFEQIALCVFFFNSILSSLLPKGSGKMFVFMLHETRYIIHGVKQPEKLLGC